MCESTDAVINSSRGDLLRSSGFTTVLQIGVTPDDASVLNGTCGGRAIIDRQTIHIHDIIGGFDTEFPGALGTRTLMAVRTFLATPLLREGSTRSGVVVIRRSEVRPFTEKQVALLKTFADQAVIAIENVRLFKELQARNRDLTEALERQTATSEILAVIASSPTDIQPVVNAVAESAARLCDAGCSDLSDRG